MSAFSLSTSWNAHRHDNGYDIVDEIKRIGFDTIELSFALTENIVNDIVALKDASKINISSAHNMCPLPEEIERDEASPDYYSLAATDEAERGLAVSIVKNTISCANRLGARAVVLHTGRVQIKDRTRDLAALAGDKVRSENLRRGMIEERSAKKDGYLDNVIKSLAETIPYAKEMKVSLGIENRYYYREIPIIDELGEMFKVFKPGDLYYWHDAGHAEVFERLGLVRHKDLLERFQDRLLGLHLHDIIGANKDHNAPGSGEFDFRMLKPYVRPETIKVIEAHHPATAGEIRKSVEYLSKIFGT